MEDGTDKLEEAQASAENRKKNQLADESDMEMIETDDEEVEEITIIELSDTEIREEDEDEESGVEEFVIKEEPLDDYGDGFVNFDPSQLGVIVTETELPEDLIGGPINGMYKCKFCPQKYPTKSRLIAHVERHINNGSIRKCRFCDFFTAVKQTLLEHECKHTNEKLYQCSECNHRCRLKGDLARHEEVHTNSRRYQCKECGHRTRTAANLRRHMERHWPDMPRNFTCRLCGFAFKRESALKMHLNRKHNDNKPFFCDQCSFCCKTMWELKSHKAKHSDDHPYACHWPGCRKAFKTKSDCNKHYKRHSGVKDYECSLCGKKFFSSTQLKKHAPTHSDVRNFECGECLKKFKTLRALKGHLLTHLTVKPFRCDVCYKTFGTQFNLDMHKRVHEGGRPYQCPICVHGSREMEHLMAHVGSEHLFNFTYVCGLCRKPFGKSFHLQLHIQRCHKDEMRGREETVVYEPDYLDHNFEPEASGSFDPTTFAKYLASENQKSAESRPRVKEEPGLDNSPSDSGISNVSNSSPKESSASPGTLSLPPVVQLGRYGGVPFCLARKNSGLELNCQKKGKKPKRWFMDMSQMTEADAERHREYLRKKELGLLTHYRRRKKRSVTKTPAKRGRKSGAKQKAAAKGRWQSRKVSWTAEEDDSDEEEAYLLGRQLVLQLGRTGSQGLSDSQRSSSRARKPAVHFKNLPDNFCDVKQKPASVSKKASITGNTKADLSLLQPSTSCYLGGKTANRKRNKQTVKKKPAQPSKKLSKKKAALSSKPGRRNPKTCMKPPLRRRIKKETAGDEKSWALALASPLPVSHYRPEEAALNTQCWLRALQSSVTKGHFGSALSQHKTHVATTDHRLGAGDQREEFFGRCLQLQVRVPRDKSEDDSSPSSHAAGVLPEKVCDGDLAQRVEPEISVPCRTDCLGNVEGEVSIDSSSAKAQAHDTVHCDSEQNDPDSSIRQECLSTVMEAVCMGQDTSHRVPALQNSDNSREISSSNLTENDVSSERAMNDAEANNTRTLQFTYDFDQTRKGGSDDKTNKKMESGMQILSAEHVTALEENSDYHQERHCEPLRGSGENGGVSAPQSSENRTAAVEGDDSQTSLQKSLSEDHRSVEACARGIHSEEKAGTAAICAGPERKGKLSHTREGGGKDLHSAVSVSEDIDLSAPCQHEDSITLNLNLSQSQQEDCLPSSTNLQQNNNGCESSTTSFSGMGNTDREPWCQEENVAKEEKCPSEPVCQKEAISGKNAEMQMSSVKVTGQNESSEELKPVENITQEKSETDKENTLKENCSTAHLELTIRQDDFGVERLQSELVETIAITETCSEMPLQSELNAHPHPYCHPADCQRTPDLLTDTRQSADTDLSNHKECTGNKEIVEPDFNHTGHVSQNFEKTDVEAIPTPQSSAVDNLETYSHQNCPLRESGQTANGEEERIHSVMVEKSADVVFDVQSTVQCVKCLHVLVSDVQIKPCSSDYLHSLGVSKVLLNVHPLLSVQTSLKTKRKVFKPCTKNSKSPNKKIKQAVSKTGKSPKTAKQKTNASQQKRSKGTPSPAKNPKVKTAKTLKRPLMDPASVVPESGIAGISGLLLATATTVRPGKPPAKSAPKSLHSKQKKTAGKAATSAPGRKQNKSTSKIKRPRGKAKQLSSKTSSPKKSGKQLMRSKKQKARKQNTADGVSCTDEQNKGRAQKSVVELCSSSRNTMSIKVESEELGETLFYDVATAATAKRAYTSAPKKQRAKCVKKSPKPKHLSAPESCVVEGGLVDPNPRYDGQVASSLPRVREPEFSDRSRTLLDANTSAYGMAEGLSAHNKEVSTTELSITTASKKQDSGERGCSESGVAIEPSLISAEDGIASVGLKESASVPAGMTMCDQGMKSSSAVGSHVGPSDSSGPVPPVKKRGRPKLVKPAETKKRPYTKQKKSMLQKAILGNAVKDGRRSNSQLRAKIQQAKARCLNSNSKASTQQNTTKAAADSASVTKSANSAFKIIKPNRTTEGQPSQSNMKVPKKRGRKPKNPPQPNPEKDMTRKRKKYMYVETDTGEFPDPPAKKRGRPPGPKIILDRSQVNLCFESAPVSTEPEWTGVQVTADGTSLDGEISLVLPGAVQSVNSQPSVVYGESGMQSVSSALPPQLVQSASFQDASELPLSTEACLTQFHEAQFTDADIADIKPTLSELRTYIPPDVKPGLDELRVLSGPVTAEILPPDTHVPDPLTAEQSQTQSMRSSNSAANSEKTDDARAALLQVLTSHLDMSHCGTVQSCQSSISSVHPVTYVQAVPLGTRGRKRKSKDRTLHFPWVCRPGARVLNDGDRRRSDRRKKLRLSEEQIRRAEQDLADSDLDWEEGDNLCEPDCLDREDLNPDIEFVGADYSHVDLGSQRLSLDGLTQTSFPAADLSKEGMAVEAIGVTQGGESNFPGIRSAGVATAADLNPLVLRSQQGASKDIHGVGQGYSAHLENHASAQGRLPETGNVEESQPSPFVIPAHLAQSVCAPPALQTFSVKASPSACSIIPMGEGNQARTIPQPLNNHGSPGIKEISTHQAPTGSGVVLSHSQLTSQGEVPIGSQQSVSQQTSHFEVPVGSQQFLSQRTNHIEVPIGSQQSVRQRTNYIEVPIGSQQFLSQWTSNIEVPIRSQQSMSQRTSHVEVPIGSGLSSEGAASLTISVKTIDGQNVLL
ncbi:uncharacterized protein LOC143286040 [Babylonia areolata]|uniref:uncharacterized protein LOC143286040 n=1 Tax=Babylonia areolata TaxID=304850 RepID=UPI003FCEF191